MNLIVDIGNTLVKSALLERGRVVEERADGVFCPEAVAGLLERGRVRRAILSSTRGEMPSATSTGRRRRWAATGWPPPWGPRSSSRVATC